MKNLITYLSKKSLSLGNGSGMIREWLGIASMKSRKSFAVLYLLFALGISNVWGYTGTFSKCTGTLTSGYYVFGVVESSTMHAVNNTVGTSWIKYTDVTISTNITNPNNAVVWYYDATAGTIKNVDNTNYIYWTSGNVGCCGATSYAHDVIEASTGIYTVRSHATTSRILRRNGTSGYRYYTGLTGSQQIQFYKLSASCTTKLTMTKAAASNGSFTLHKDTYNGTEIAASPATSEEIDNCGSGTTTVVVVPVANSGYACTAVSVTNKKTLTGPDGSGNYTITYDQGSAVSSTVTVTFLQKCSTPTFSPSSYAGSDAQTVTISCATDGATIYYTTDGSAPTTSSSVYSTSLNISSTTTVKAIAVKDGKANSDVGSATYTIKNGKLFSLVTNASELTAGDELVILGISSTPAYYLMSTTQNGNNRGKTDENGDWEFIDDDIFVEEKVGSTVQIINLEGSTGAWYFNVGTDSYLYAASSSSNYLRSTSKASAGDNGKWAITIGSDPYNATVTAQGTNTHNLLQYNQSNSIFSCYGSSQQAIRIYRYANTSPNVDVGTPTGTSFSYTYGSGPSSAQTFTISGSNLTGNVVINAPSNYKIKKGSDSWSSSITLTPSSGTIASTTISIQLVAGLNAGSYNGNITFTNSDDLTISPIALTGTVNKATLNPSFGETTYTIVRDVSTSTTFTLTGVPSDYTGTITYSRTNNPTASARLTIDGTNKTFTANYSGRWTVTAQFAADANYNAKASGVTCTVNAVMRDTYVDNVNGQSVTEAQRTDDGVNPYTSPSLSDVAAGSACKGTKTHLIGWATATFIANVGNGTLTGADSDYTQANGFYAVGETLPAASGATYYAVYGEEE